MPRGTVAVLQLCHFEPLVAPIDPTPRTAAARDPPADALAPRRRKQNSDERSRTRSHGGRHRPPHTRRRGGGHAPVTALDATPSSAAVGTAEPDPRRWWSLAVLCMTLLVIGLDNTILN